MTERTPNPADPQPRGALVAGDVAEPWVPLPTDGGSRTGGLAVGHLPAAR